MERKFLPVIKNNKSLSLLYLIVLIPVLTMCYFLYSDYSYRKNEEIKKNEQMAKVLAENLDSYLANVKTTLQSVSILSPIQNGERTKIEAIFQSLEIADNQVSLFWALDKGGNIIAKYPNKWPNKRDEGLIKMILQGSTVISGPYEGTITGQEIITVSTLVKDSSGRIKGAVGASIPLENIRKKLITKVGTSGYPILVTRSGKFLVHPQLEKINKKVDPNDTIFRTIKKGGSGTLDIVAPFDGQQKFFSYVPLKQANWVILVIQPLSEFHAQILKLFTRNGVLIILVIFIVVISAYYLILLRKREEEARIFQTEKLSVVGQLAAGMAHEIRNPLTTIRGFAQLATERTDGLITEYLEIIISEVDRIESIVKETVLLAKPTPTQFQAVNIKQLLQEVHALMETQTNLNDIKLSFNFEDELPLIHCEPNQLKQVFINLIRNSIDASPKTKGEIAIVAKTFDNNIMITVQDNGSGIPPELIDKLGNPFISTKENGTGLGLMVTYRIIQNHDGKISLLSTKESGTIFTIELPASKIL